MMVIESDVDHEWAVFRAGAEGLDQVPDWLEDPDPAPPSITDLDPGSPGWARLRVLSGLDRDGLASEEFDDLLAERVRLTNAQDGELLLDLWYAGRAAMSLAGRYTWKSMVRHDYAATRIAMVLGWPPHEIDRLLLAADELVGQLPAVLSRLLVGELDLPRAMAFAEILRHLADKDKARQIADGRLATLTDNPHWPLENLRESLRYHIDRADQTNQRRRHQARVAERGVAVADKADGCSSFIVYDLPTPRALAMKDRAIRLARAARAEGDPRGQRQLEADAVSDLILGVPFTVRPGVEASTTQADTPHPTTDDDPPPPPEPSPAPGDVVSLNDHEASLITDTDRQWLFDQDHNPNPDPDPDSDQGRDRDPASRSQTGIGPEPGLDSRSQTGMGPEPGLDSRSQTGMGAEPDSFGTPEGEGGGRFAELGVLPGDRCTCGGLLPTTPGGTVRITITLATLAGVNNDPALIARGGSILADQARALALGADNPLWRWSLRTPDGRLLHHGTTTTTRPTPTESRSGTGTTESRSPTGTTESRSATGTTDSRSGTGTTDSRSGTGMADSRSGTGMAGGGGDRVCTCPRVRIADKRSIIDIQVTRAMLQHPPAGWEQVAADIAAQVASQPPPERWRERNPDGTLKDHGYTGRFFPAEERAFIQARFRTCRGPHCRRSAQDCDCDHVVEQHNGGPSHRGNGEPLCLRHHHLRDIPSVRVELRDDGTVIWTMPNGRQFTVLPTRDLLVVLDDDAMDNDEPTGNDETTSGEEAASRDGTINSEDAGQVDLDHDNQ